MAADEVSPRAYAPMLSSGTVHYSCHTVLFDIQYATFMSHNTAVTRRAPLKTDQMYALLINMVII